MLDFLGLASGGLLRQRVGVVFVFGLLCKALVALTHLVVGNQRGDVVVFEMLDIGIAVVTRMRRRLP